MAKQTENAPHGESDPVAASEGGIRLTGPASEGVDPAAAPLETDQEAAGAPARDFRRDPADPGSSRSNPNAATPELQPDGRLPSQSHGFVVIAGLVAGLVLGAVLLLALQG